MNDTRTSPHAVEPGGAIILRLHDGGEFHFLASERLGDGLPAASILPEVLAILEASWGPILASERGGDSDTMGPGWPRWMDWDLYRASTYTVERRGEERYSGASGYWEQILIGLIAAVAYDAVKLVAAKIAATLKRRTPNDASAGEVRPIASLENRLQGDFGARLPLVVEETTPHDALKCFRVRDADGRTFSVAFDGQGAIIWVVVKVPDTAA